ncbi:MAG: Gfo/Idh/MocA family oxidoreductase [Thermoguttaceae bacterium]|jgi:predicted dehydrogenase
MAGNSSRREFLKDLGAGAVGAVAAGSAGLAAADKPASSSAAPAAPAMWKPVSDRKIRLGVVGGGFGASFDWHRHPNCAVVAVSDLQTGRRDGLMKVFQCEKSYGSLEQLVLDDKIEAVAVFTDAPSHGRHCVEVMKRGKHCISAVPAAMNIEDCQKLKEIKEKTGLKYMMAESSYYHSAVIRGRNLYAQGCKLVYSEGHYYHDGVTRIDSWKNWRYALPPMLYPTHSTAYYVGVTGKRLVKASCLGWRGEGEEWRRNQYDNAPFVNESAMFYTSENTMFRCNVFWKCDAGGESGGHIWETRPTVDVPSSVPLPPSLSAGGHGGSAGPIVNEFVMAIVEDREPAINIYESLGMTAPGIVAHQSALKNGEVLDVPSIDKKPA